MRRVFLLVLLLACVVRADEAAFQAEAAKFGMKFAQPKGWSEQKPPEDFQYAMSDGQDAILYWLRPAGDDYVDSLTKLAALSSNQKPEAIESQHFPPADVKNEFGADDGLLTFFNNPEGQGFCLLCVFHKKGAGDAFVYYMSQDKDTLLKMIEDQSVFRALVFK